VPYSLDSGKGPKHNVRGVGALRTRHTLETLAWHWNHWPGRLVDRGGKCLCSKGSNPVEKARTAPLDEWKLPDESPWIPWSLHPSPRAIVSPEMRRFSIYIYIYIYGRILKHAPVQGCKTLIYSRRVSDTHAATEDAPFEHGRVLEDARSGCIFASYTSVLGDI